MSNTRMMVMFASLERLMTDERKAVKEAIIGQNAIPVGLAYPAIPANYIHKLNLKCLADSDYLLLVVGQEYGPLTDKGVGYLHAIYSAAIAARKPIVSLVYNGAALLGTESMDQKRLAGFLELVPPSTIYEWASVDELRDCVERALEETFELYPSAGWSKSDSLTSASLKGSDEHNVIHKLKQQISQLKERVRSVSSTPDKTSLPSDLSEHQWLLDYQCNAFREGRLKQLSGEHSFTLATVFEWLGPSMLAPASEAKLHSVLARNIQPTVLAKTRKSWPGSHAVSDVKVSFNAIETLKVKLRAQGLIEFDNIGNWMLTSAGERLVLSHGLSR